MRRRVLRDTITMDRYMFELECSICDAELTVTVLNEDEKPGFCPMCGTAVVFEEE